MGTTVFSRGAGLLVSFIICSSASTPVFAETQKLALPQVVELSLQNNGDLRSFREEKGIRDAGKIRADLLPNPTLELEGVTGSLTGSSDESSMSIGVSQEFFLAGKRAKRLAIAERELEVYQWQLADRERLLREEVKTAFHDAVLAQKQADLADRAIDLNRQLFDVTRERLAAGDIPELEMNLVKVELARSEGSRITGTKLLQQRLGRLRDLMGWPGGPAPMLADSLAAEVTVTKPLLDLQQLARSNRPDLKALEAERHKGEAETVLSEAERIPNLTVGIFYSHERRTDETGSGEEAVRDNLLGIRLSLPIPVFDNNQAGVQEARVKKSSSEIRLIAADRNAEREVETAYASLLNAEKILSLYTSNIIPQLEENLQLTQEAYRLGEVGILAVIQEQKKFFEVSDAYLLALHDRQTALVKLESAAATDLSGGVQ